MHPSSAAPRSFSIALGLLLAAALSATAHGQGPAWYQEVDGPAQDIDQPTELLRAPNDGMFVGGHRSGDALVQRYDAAGNELWSRTFDGGSADWVSALAFDRASGALYVAGYATDLNWFLLRLDASTGALVWQRTYVGANPGGRVKHLVVDASGAVVVGGWTRAGTSSADLAVVRWEADGTPSWQWTFGTPDFDYILGLQPRPGGGVVIERDAATHTLHALDGTGAEQWSRDLYDSIGLLVDSGGNVLYVQRSSPRVFKLDPLGNVLWSTAVMHLSEHARLVQLVGQDHVVVMSDANRLARVDASGALLWSTPLPTPERGWLFCTPMYLAAAADGDLVVAGRRAFTNASFDESLVVQRWSGDGAFLWGERLRGYGGRSLRPVGAVGGPGGSIVTLGTVGLSLSIQSVRDIALATVQPQTRNFCFGDGSGAACPCGNEGNENAGCAGATGTGTLVADGVASLATDSLRFSARGYFSGLSVLVQASSSAPPVPFQSGLSCQTGAFVRIAASVASAGGGGVKVDQPSGPWTISGRSTAGGDTIAPGSKRTYQVYFRDGPGPCSGAMGSLTNAVEVLWQP